MVAQKSNPSFNH